MILILFLTRKIYSWKQRPYVKANGGGDEAESGGWNVLSCLLDPWSVAPANRFAEAISTPVREPWHLIGIITHRQGRRGRQWVCVQWVTFAFHRRREGAHPGCLEPPQGGRIWLEQGASCFPESKDCKDLRQPGPSLSPWWSPTIKEAGSRPRCTPQG